MRPPEIRIQELLKTISASQRMIALHTKKVEFAKTRIQNLEAKGRDEAERLKQAGING